MFLNKIRNLQTFKYHPSKIVQNKNCQKINMAQAITNALDYSLSHNNNCCEMQININNFFSNIWRRCFIWWSI